MFDTLSIGRHASTPTRCRDRPQTLSGSSSCSGGAERGPGRPVGRGPAEALPLPEDLAAAVQHRPQQRRRLAPVCLDAEMTPRRRQRPPDPPEPSPSFSWPLSRCPPPIRAQQHLRAATFRAMTCSNPKCSTTTRHFGVPALAPAGGQRTIFPAPLRIGADQFIPQVLWETGCGRLRCRLQTGFDAGRGRVVHLALGLGLPR